MIIKTKPSPFFICLKLYATIITNQGSHSPAFTYNAFTETSWLPYIGLRIDS